jgi:uncharacterized protein
VALRSLPADDRVSVAWKNGGGLTCEVAVQPPGSDFGAFDWRVSIAEVRSRGAFSLFPGVDRCMAVLEGRLALSIGGRDALSLSPDTPPLHFPGDVAVSAEPLGEAVTDLNVMTRRGRCESRLTRCLVRESTPLTLRADTALILALSALGLRCGAEHVGLSKLDAALIAGPTECEVQPHDSHGSFYLIELMTLTR